MANWTCFHFTTETELALVRIVVLKEVHVCDFGNIGDEGAAVVNMFLTKPKVINQINTRGTTPSWGKNVTEIFQAFRKDRRALVRK